MKPATRLAGTHRLESRMREIRPSGSEGGVALRAIPTPMPLISPAATNASPAYHFLAVP